MRAPFVVERLFPKVHIGIHFQTKQLEFGNHCLVGDAHKALDSLSLPLGGFEEHVKRAYVELLAVLVDICFIEWTIHERVFVFRPAVVFGVMADAVDVVRIVVVHATRVMLVVVVVAPLWPLTLWRKKWGYHAESHLVSTASFIHGEGSGVYWESTYLTSDIFGCIKSEEN